MVLVTSVFQTRPVASVSDVWNLLTATSELVVTRMLAFTHSVLVVSILVLADDTMYRIRIIFVITRAHSRSSAQAVGASRNRATASLRNRKNLELKWNPRAHSLADVIVLQKARSFRQSCLCVCVVSPSLATSRSTCMHTYALEGTLCVVGYVRFF